MLAPFWGLGINKTEMAIALVVINTLGEKNRLFKKGEKF